VSVVIIQKVIVTVKKPLVNPMTGEMDLRYDVNDISQDYYLYQRRETLPQRIIGFFKTLISKIKKYEFKSSR
jgi:hypothetical protein